MKSFKLALMLAACSFVVAQENESNTTNEVSTSVESTFTKTLESMVDRTKEVAGMVTEVVGNKAKEFAGSAINLKDAVVDRAKETSVQVSAQVSDVVTQAPVVFENFKKQSVQVVNGLVDQLPATLESITDAFEQSAQAQEQADQRAKENLSAALNETGELAKELVEKVSSAASSSSENTTTKDTSVDSTNVDTTKKDVAITSQDSSASENKNTTVEKQKEEVQVVPASWFEQAQTTMTQSMTTMSQFVGNHPYTVGGTVFVTVAAAGVYAYTRDNKDAEFEQN